MFTNHMGSSTIKQPLHFLWLEITGRCQLECVHCYADSSPKGTHGSMTKNDWIRVIEESRKLGVMKLQFIGGEPTLHPDFPLLLEEAVKRKIKVEVFTNLVHITSTLWAMFSRLGISLATSWYSNDANEHAKITNRNSFHNTKNAIKEAVRRNIPIRVGVIGISQNQQVKQAHQLLIDLGVDEKKIGYDELRQVGRGVRDAKPGPDQLCGNCADGVMAISPSGEVWPCVFSRWMPLGNVLDQSLSELVIGNVMNNARTKLKQFFKEQDLWPCEPKCSPRCSPSCSPCTPGNTCWPDYD